MEGKLTRKWKRAGIRSINNELYRQLETYEHKDLINMVMDNLSDKEKRRFVLEWYEGDIDNY